MMPADRNADPRGYDYHETKSNEQLDRTSPKYMTWGELIVAYQELLDAHNKVVEEIANQKFLYTLIEHEVKQRDEEINRLTKSHTEVMSKEVAERLKDMIDSKTYWSGKVFHERKVLGYYELIETIESFTEDK